MNTSALLSNFWKLLGGPLLVPHPVYALEKLLRAGVCWRVWGHHHFWWGWYSRPGFRGEDYYYLLCAVLLAQTRLNKESTNQSLHTQVVASESTEVRLENMMWWGGHRSMWLHIWKYLPFFASKTWFYFVIFVKYQDGWNNGIFGLSTFCLSYCGRLPGIV